MINWAYLSGDLLHDITGHLNSYEDYVRCRAVCAHWNSAIPKKPLHKKFKYFPSLFIPYDDGKDSSHALLNICERKLCHMKLPQVQGKNIRGFSFGWLFLVGETPELTLLEPFTLAQIHLPPITTLPGIVYYNPERGVYGVISELIFGLEQAIPNRGIKDGYLRKVILSSNPSKDNNFMAATIYGEVCNLAFCRYGDKKWTKLTDEYVFNDIIFLKERLYAVTMDQEIMVFDISCPFPSARIIPSNIWTEKDEGLPECRVYLVAGSSEELMVVLRFYDYDWMDDSVFDYYKTSKFIVYKVSVANEIEQVKCFNHDDDEVLLIGINDSLYITVHNFPSGKGNCIYFTDDYVKYHYEGPYQGYDIGVFDMKDESIHSLVGCPIDTYYVSPSDYYFDVI